MTDTAWPEGEYVKDEPEVTFTDDDADNLTHDIAALAGTVESLETTVAKAVEWLFASGGLPHLAETLDLIRGRRQQLHRLEAYVEAKTAQLAKEQGLLRKGTTLPDGRRVEFKGGAERRDWQVDDVLRDVTRASLRRIGLTKPGACDVVDAETGESRPLPEVVGELRGDLVAVLPNAANSMRVTRMKDLGLTPGDYCTTSAGRRTVYICEAAS